MGVYLNPGSARFEEAVNSEIFVDKTELIDHVNSVVKTSQKYLSVSRPRRFGKSYAADMLCAYYGLGAEQSIFDDAIEKMQKLVCREIKAGYPEAWDMTVRPGKYSYPTRKFWRNTKTRPKGKSGLLYSKHLSSRRSWSKLYGEETQKRLRSCWSRRMTVHPIGHIMMKQR